MAPLRPDKHTHRRGDAGAGVRPTDEEPPGKGPPDKSQRARASPAFSDGPPRSCDPFAEQVVRVSTHVASNLQDSPVSCRISVDDLHEELASGRSVQVEPGKIPLVPRTSPVIPHLSATCMTLQNPSAKRRRGQTAVDWVQGGLDSRRHQVTQDPFRLPLPFDTAQGLAHIRSSTCR